VSLSPSPMRSRPEASPGNGRGFCRPILYARETVTKAAPSAHGVILV
jgi:hypothetical protein